MASLRRRMMVWMSVSGWYRHISGEEDCEVVRSVCVFFFFFKQKTAYEIYQCDWSSDVCSSDLAGRVCRGSGRRAAAGHFDEHQHDLLAHGQRADRDRKSVV